MTTGSFDPMAGLDLNDRKIRPMIAVLNARPGREEAFQQSTSQAGLGHADACHCRWSFRSTASVTVQVGGKLRDERLAKLIGRE